MKALLFLLLFLLPQTARVVMWQAASTSAVILNWTAATDDVTKQPLLLYEVRQSSTCNIDTVANAEANGISVLGYGSGRTTATISGLTPGGTYCFNVIVRDEAGNKSAYQMVKVTMPSVNELATKIISPLNNATVRSKIMVSMTAADETGITRVELWVQGLLMAWYPGGGLTRMGNELTGTYTYQLETFPYNGRVMRLESRVYDADNHIAMAVALVPVTK